MKKLLTLIVIALLCTTAATAQTTDIERDKAAIEATKKELSDIQAEYSQTSRQYNGQMPDSLHTNLVQRYENAAKSLIEQIQKFVDNYPGTVDGAKMLYILVRQNKDEYTADRLEEILQAYNGIECDELQRMRDMLAGMRNSTVGATVTNLTMPTPDGQMMNLTDVVGHGQYVLVDFWASWCGPCRGDMPHVKELYAKYHPKGFEIVGVSFDNKHEAWTEAIKTLDLPWLHMSDIQGWKSKGAEVYDVHAIPCTILFDPEGKVVAKNLRGNALTEKLAEIYGD